MGDEDVIIGGKVEWIGENPGIMLQEAGAENLTALASFFRIFHSPEGPGVVLVLMTAPTEREESGEKNVCLTDNPKLANYIIENFVSHFGSFGHTTIKSGIQTRAITKMSTINELPGRYCEIVEAGNLNVQLVWNHVGPIFTVAFPPSVAATKQHTMVSTLADSQSASIVVNGTPLAGSSQPRQVAGQDVSSSLLAWAETWLRVDLTDG